MKYGIGLFILLILGGCNSLGVKKAELPPEPEWLLNPPLDNGAFWFGVARAVSPQEAEQRALATIAARLQTTIRATTEQQIRVSAINGAEQLRRQSSQTVASETTALTFTNYQVTQRQRLGNDYAVLVQVDRGSFITAQQRRYQQMRQELTSTLDHLAQQSRLRQLKGIGRVKAQLAAFEPVQSLLVALGGLDAPLDLNAQRQQIQQMAQSLTFALRYAPQWQGVAEVVQEALTREGFAVVAPNALAREGVLIQLEVEQQSQKLYGSFMRQLQLQITLKERDGTTLASRHHTLNGASAVSSDAAYLAALATMRQQWQQQPLMAQLGIHDSEN